MTEDKTLMFDKDKLGIVLIAHAIGDLSEGQASAVLGIDRLKVREEVLNARMMARGAWEVWRGENPPDVSFHALLPTKRCQKAPHTGTGLLHDEIDDGPYDVDGVEYCGRCHVVLHECAHLKK